MSTDPHQHGTPASQTAAAPDARRPRTGPIVWGALILVFCAYVFQQAVAPGSVNAMTWAIFAVIGLGLLLLIVGVTVIIRSRRSHTG